MLALAMLSGCSGIQTLPQEEDSQALKSGSAEANTDGKISADEITSADDTISKENADSEQYSGKLSKEELQELTYFINTDNNYGFLLSEYADPSEIDLTQVFYNGIPGVSEPMTSEEKEAYLQITGEEGIETDCIRVTTSQMDEYLQKMMGISFGEVPTGLPWWSYLEEWGEVQFGAYAPESQSKNKVNVKVRRRIKWGRLQMKMF